MWVLIAICLALGISLTMAVISDIRSKGRLKLLNQVEIQNLLRAAETDPYMDEEEYQELKTALEDFNKKL